MAPTLHTLLIATTMLAAATAQSAWTQLPLAVQPAARGWHAITFDFARSTSILFGGWDGHDLGDTWEWNGTAWAQFAPTSSPPARSDHAMAWDFLRGEIVLFGGISRAGDLGDTWVFGGGNWIQRPTSFAPTARTGARLAFDPISTDLLLFGGGGGSSSSPLPSETWLWNGSAWSLRQPLHNPPARFWPALACDFFGGRLVMFGGWEPLFRNDTWSWNGADWTQLATTSAPTDPRYPVLTADIQSQQLALHCARHSYSALLTAETWVLVGDQWRRDPRPQPPSIDAEACFSEATQHGLMRFGGMDTYGSNYVAGTWRYDPVQVATWTPFGAGCAGALGVPTLAAGRSLPMLGSTSSLTLDRAPTALAAFAVGASASQWNGNALPLDLGALGMPGCTLLTSTDVLRLATANGGQATLMIAVPTTAALAGTRLFVQGFALDPSANALGVVTSNALAGVVGVF